MLNIEIKSLGVALPKNYVDFKGGRRYRISGEENHLGLLCKSAENALANSGLKIDDIDVIIGACAVGLQPIPCTAALIHKVISHGRRIPAFDINSTCTSFITALDVIGYQIQAGRYKNALIVSGDVCSIALNENERHSFELFGDGAVSAVVSRSETSSILYAAQMTCSKGAHLTEIVGGGTALPAYYYNENNKEKYQFHMEGRAALSAIAGLLQEAIDHIEENSGFKLRDIDMVIPHQASSALGLIMRRLNISENKYIDITKQYGNMVSASVPFAFNHAIEQGSIERGDIVLLLGSAAGLTLNAMIIKY